MFLTADVYTKRNIRDGVVRRHQAEDVLFRHWVRDDVEMFIPDTECDTPISVRVNHGRWIVVCECGAAQFASKTDHRFLCVQCLNEPYAGAWRPVIWPHHPDQVEALLRNRLTENCNWLPDEPLSQLRLENEAMGVIDGVDHT